MKRIVFFNQFHNGDCFLGKNYVREIQRLLPQVEFAYAHNNHPDILKDLELEQLNLVNIPAIDRLTRVAESADKQTVFINTWVGCWQGAKFPHGQHINYVRLHDVWREYFNYLKLDLHFVEDPNYYLPVIDATKFDVAAADNWISEHSDKPAMLFCNGSANSGQSRATELHDCIDAVSTAHPEYNILVTHKLPLNKPNIYYTDDIFSHLDSDINQIAYLARACDLIVGKNSGPFSYCQNATNLMDASLAFLNLSILATDCPSGGGIYKARCIHSADTNDFRIANIIKFILSYPDYRGTEIIS